MDPIPRDGIPLGLADPTAQLDVDKGASPRECRSSRPRTMGELARGRSV